MVVAGFEFVLPFCRLFPLVGVFCLFVCSCLVFRAPLRVHRRSGTYAELANQTMVWLFISVLKRFWCVSHDVSSWSLGTKQQSVEHLGNMWRLVLWVQRQHRVVVAGFELVVPFSRLFPLVDFLCLCLCVHA